MHDIFDIVHRLEIGLQLVMSSLLPFSCRGMILAVFHCSGILFSVYMSLQSWDNGDIRISAPSLNIRNRILSNPSQFLIFSVFRICMMFGSVIKFSFAFFAIFSYFIYNFSKVSITFIKPKFDIASICILFIISLIVI